MLKDFELKKSFMCSNLFRFYIKQIAIAPCASLLFLPNFDVICDLLLNRRKATWNLFVN